MLHHIISTTANKINPDRVIYTDIGLDVELDKGLDREKISQYDKDLLLSPIIDIIRYILSYISI